MQTLFLTNKYTRCYYSIVTSAAQEKRVKAAGAIYYEKHHIIPKSIGGTNEDANLVFLTAREHYICHMLLTKMTSGASRRKMCYAFWGLNNQASKYQARYSSSKLYAYSKKIMQESLSLERAGKTLIERYGESRAAEIKNNMAKRKSRGSPSLSERISISVRVKAAYQKAPRIIPRPPKKECEKCKMLIDLGNYTRHHGEKCKRETRPCLNCGSSFSTVPYENKKYCCSTCANSRKVSE